MDQNNSPNSNSLEKSTKRLRNSLILSFVFILVMAAIFSAQTYAYFWDNSVAHNLMEAVMFYWVAGVFAVAMMVLFSVVFSNGTGVLLGTGGVFAVCYLVAMVPKIAKFLPTKLMSTSGLLAAVDKVSDYQEALIVTIVITVLAFVTSVPILNKKKL